MSTKQDKKLRKLARQATHAMQFEAVSMLNAVKESWTREERQVLADWLLDDEAPGWGEK